MELFINGAPIEIETADTDTVQAVISSVTDALADDTANSGLIIVSMDIDGRHYIIEDPAALSIPVSQIQRIDLSVSSRLELCLAFLSEGKTFVETAAKELQNGSTAHQKEFANTFGWILESLDALKGSIAFPPADIHMLRAIIADALRRLDGVLTVDDAVELGRHLSGLPDMFDVIADKISNENEHSKSNVIAQLQELLRLCLISVINLD